MENISPKVEKIFTHGALLHQSGRLRSSIFGYKQYVYILNSDNTLLLRFNTRLIARSIFKTPFSFYANDYESNRLYQDGNKIVFEESNAEYDKKKTCGVPHITPEEVHKLYNDYTVSEHNVFSLSANIVSLLEENLSHCEIKSENKQIHVIQRDVYSGALIDVTKNKPKGFAVTHTDELKSDFELIGIRTNDLMALFAFQKSIKFFFPKNPTKNSFCKLSGEGMEGLMSFCLYDELKEKKVTTKKKVRKK